MEIDIYCPDFKIGIEYNGNLFHSELFGKKNMNYHLNKSQLALECGIKLYHIHDDEWDNNKNLIKAKLLHIFNINKNLSLFNLDSETINKTTLFLNRRWFPSPQNNDYVDLGFKYIETIPPDYSYYKLKSHISERLNKINYSKENIKLLYPDIYDENKTEWQMMQELGFDRIWDCGKFKYEIKNNKLAD
jgi:hypothetical protein